MVHRFIVFFVLMFLFYSCSDDSCNYLSFSQPYDDISGFRNIPIFGVYKVSEKSTDKTFSEYDLENSYLFILCDSTDQSNTSGTFYFQNYPAWYNLLHINKLDSLYGNWHITNRPGGIFNPDKLLFEPFFIEEEGSKPKSLVVGLDIRLQRERPIIVVRVMKDLDNDSKNGYSLVYPTPKYSGYCNYLIYEKVSSNVSSVTKNNIKNYFDANR